MRNQVGALRAPAVVRGGSLGRSAAADVPPTFAAPPVAAAPVAATALREWGVPWDGTLSWRGLCERWLGSRGIHGGWLFDSITGHGVDLRERRLVATWLRRRLHERLPRQPPFPGAVCVTNDSYFTAMTFPRGLPVTAQPNSIHDAAWAR